MFRTGLYCLAVSRNAFEITDLRSGETTRFTPATPFTSHRLLVGDFVAAESALLQLLKQIKAPGLSTLVIHPLEMNEGGLCFVEQRALTEMALGAGARAAFIHEGPRLDREGYLAVIKEGRRTADRPVRNGREIPTWASLLVIAGFIALLAFLAMSQHAP